MLQSPTASRTVTSSNQSGTDPTKPAGDAFNSQEFRKKLDRSEDLIPDLLRTGRKPTPSPCCMSSPGMRYTGPTLCASSGSGPRWTRPKYAYFTDAHIHTGIPLNRMVTAAEILRYTSTNTEELEWTAKDTADFTAHLIHPVIDLPASQRLLYEPASVHRWDYYGDSRDIHVRRSVLWADVDHPINIGTHGSYERDGDIIENIRFEDLDILEHHEPQPDYWGCIAINPGDKNTVRKIRFENIRIEPFELGEPFNIRVKYNPKYNPAPGSRIEDILFKDITCDGKCPNPSRIEGYDDNRVVDGITFENVTIDGVRMTAGSGHLQVRDHVRNLTVR